MKLSFIQFVKLVFIYKKSPFYHHYIKGKKTLDVACGQGKLLERDPDRIIGIDLDEKLVSECQAKGLKVYKQSCTSIEFPAESFEAVNCSNIIEHLHPEQAVQMLNQCARVLKKGGILLIDTPSEKNVWNTFSHIKPYPPIALQKLLDRPTEGYLSSENSLHSLEIEDIFHKGMGQNRILYALYFCLCSFFLNFKWTRPPLCDGYLIVLRKKY